LRFDWKDPEGDIWSNKLRSSMRIEFEMNKDVKDSYELYQLALSAKEGMRRLDQMLFEQANETQNKINNSII
jgi:hypothetical protein